MLTAVDAVCSHPELLIEHHLPVLSHLLPALSAAGEGSAGRMGGERKRVAVEHCCVVAGPTCPPALCVALPWVHQQQFAGVSRAAGTILSLRDPLPPSPCPQTPTAVASQRESPDTRFCCLKLLCDVVLQASVVCLLGRLKAWSLPHCSRCSCAT